jgi:hypothetical protein
MIISRARLLPAVRVLAYFKQFGAYCSSVLNDWDPDMFDLRTFTERKSVNSMLGRRSNTANTEDIRMSQTLTMAQKRQSSEPGGEKYFKLQINAWTNFDPMDKNLLEIALAIEQGGGLVMATEVLRIEHDLHSIGDEEVMESFENILAAKRVLQHVQELPKKLIDDLRSATNSEVEIVSQKPEGPKSASSVNLDWGRRILP